MKKLDLNKEVYAVIRGIPVKAVIKSTMAMYCANEQHEMTADIQVTEVLTNENVEGIMCGLEWSIDIRKLEPLASDSFEIGAEVRSLAGNGQSIFKVTGYEPEFNRVICLSHFRDKTDRTRYAYKPDELSKVGIVHLEIGSKHSFCYRGRISKYIVAEHLQHNRVNIVSLEGRTAGNIITAPYCERWKGASEEQLKEVGLGHIRELRRD